MSARAEEAERRDVILDHDRHPRGYGLREPFDVEVVVLNPTCGDRVTLRLSLHGARVADVSYESLGCSVSRASASVMAELVTGRGVPEALATAERFVGLLQRRGAPAPDAVVDLDDEELLGEARAFAGVGRYPLRVRCALLAWGALTDAVSVVDRRVGVAEPSAGTAPGAGDDLRHHGDGRLLGGASPEVQTDR